MRRFWSWFHAQPGWQRIAMMLGYMVTIIAFAWFILVPLLNLLPQWVAVGLLLLGMALLIAWSVRDQIRWTRTERQMQARWNDLTAEMYARAHGGESQLEDPDGRDEPGGPHRS